MHSQTRKHSDFCLSTRCKHHSRPGQTLARLFAAILLVAVASVCASPAWAVKAQSLTNLSLTSGGGAVSTLSTGSMVTMTATVTKAIGGPVSPGLVTFCDASYPVCANSAVLGTAQLDSAGIAILRFYPGIGVHSYLASFGGNTAFGSSLSPAQMLTVTGSYPTTTTLASSGNPGNYTLTGTVSGTSNPAALAGSVSFTDITDNASLGQQPLGAATTAFTLSLPAVAATGDEPGSIAVADFNGDGRLDIAVANTNFGYFQVPAHNALTILLGNGDGTFTPAPTPGINAFTDAVASADFNGDGIADLALLTSRDAYGNTDAVVLLLGNGDGTFTTGTVSPVGKQPSYIAVSDFNGDGNADIAVTNGADSTISILLGNGAGGFQAATTVATAAYPYFLLAVDVNGDGNSDLAVLDGTGNNASLFLGNGDGTFRAGAPIATSAQPLTNGITISAGDFNGDGKTDLAVVSEINTAQSPSQLFVDIFLGQGDGTFTAKPAAISISGSSNAASIVSLDANGDGKADLVFTNDQTTGLFLSNGDGTFTSAASSNQIINSSPNYSSLAAGDFNGDGVPDFAVIESDNSTVQAVLIQDAMTATASVANIPGGITVQAAYSGNADFAASTSSQLVLAGAAPAPIVALAPASLTFNAQNISSSSAAQAVTLTNTGQAPLSISSIATTGAFAQTNNCGSTVAPAATCSIAVTFNPTTAGGATGTLTITDNAANSPQVVGLSGTGSAVSLSSSATQLTIASSGGSATAAIQITAAGGFSGNVALTCAVTYTGSGTAADAPSCSLSPAQVQVSGTPATTTLTVTTTAATAAARTIGWLFPSGTTLAALLFCGLAPRREWRRGWRGARLPLLCAAVLLSLAGCGGSSRTTTPKDPGTTAGSYSVTITATGGTVKATSTLPLTVQ